MWCGKEVAVKCLKADAGQMARQDFFQEADIMKSVQNFDFSSYDRELTLC